MKIKNLLVLVSVIFLAVSSWGADKELKFDRYHSPGEISDFLDAFVKENPKIAKLHKLAVSPGKKGVFILEIGPEIKNLKKRLPAVFVAANLSGILPVSSEAALYLIQTVLAKPEARKDKTWYILPLGNPDAAAGYFKKPLHSDPRNNTPFNDDKDDQTDEDGVEDLDKNGIITMMRVKDPNGIWIPVPGEPRLMKKADPVKGEKGMYRLYSEGIDNDRDGLYNEDPAGGVDISCTFPHLFKFFSKTGGLWSGSETETFNIIRFVNDHREIALAFTFGDTNFCMVPPQGGRKGDADFTKIKLPKRIAKMFGVDDTKTFTMDEIMEMVQKVIPPGMTVTESMVASFLGLGAIVNPIQGDLKYYTELAEKYKEFLKKNKLDGKRLAPAKAGDGSFELWCYYHMGIPSFTMDLWTLPEVKDKKKKEPLLTPDKLEKMSKEDFLALGEEKIDKFLEESGAPKNIKAKMIIDAVKGGMMTTKRMAAMMRTMPKPKSKEGADPTEKAHLSFSDSKLAQKGFVDWKPFYHPTLGKIEIGGFVPFVRNTPPADMVEPLLKGQVPWIFEITEKLPRIKISSAKVEKLGGNLYRIKVWVENTGIIPYPTGMGEKNERITPIVLTLTGQSFKIVSGKKRSLVKKLAGMKSAKVEWIIHSQSPGPLMVKMQTQNAWNASRQINLGGSK